jgi:hypothetical protein
MSAGFSFDAFDGLAWGFNPTNYPGMSTGFSPGPSFRVSSTLQTASVRIRFFQCDTTNHTNPTNSTNSTAR